MGWDALERDKKAQGVDQFDLWEAAISQIESGSKEGDYSAVGPANKKGQRAYGRYQVMDFNIGPWTKEVLGKELTPEEFLKDKDAQRTVFRAKFAPLAQQYGPENAAAIWFSGRPLTASVNAKDVTGTSTTQYVEKFRKLTGSTKMATIPNMLNRPAPTLGEMAEPAPLVQDAPPKDQDEFNSRYQEALAFIKSPAMQAGLLQFALANLQPRPVGQTVLGHAAAAASQGLEAVGRVTAVEESLRRQGVKEAGEEEERGLRRKQIEQTGEYQRGTLANMSEQNRRLWKQLELQEKRLDTEASKIDAAMKRAEGRELLGHMQQLGKIYADQVKSITERLQLASDKEKPGIQEELRAAQAKLDAISQAYQSKANELMPGAFPKPEAAARPQAVTPTTEQWGEMMATRNWTGIKNLIQAGRIAPTKEMLTELEDVSGERIVPREPKNFLGRVGRAIDVVTSGGTFTANMERNLRTLDDPRATDQMKQTARAQIVEAFPQLDDKGKVPKLQLSEWELIFKDKRLEKLARARFGDKNVDEAKKQFENRKPLKDYKKERNQKELKLLE